MRAIAIGGEPASGKSTLLKSVLASLATPRVPFTYGLVRGYLYRQQRLFVLGIYEEGQTFSGTDRLSMAVQKDAERFVAHVAKSNPDHTILFEGDRLFNQKFLELCREICGASNVQAVILHASSAEKDRRHVSRKDSQSEKFKKSRATKCSNIAKNLPWVAHAENENERDHGELLNQVLGAIAPSNIPDPVEQGGH